MFKSTITQTMEATATTMQGATAPAPRLRNMERFVTATGKTEQEYQAWATQVGKQMHINTLDRLICAKLGVYTVGFLAQLPTDLPEGITDQQQVDDHLLQHSENPLELAKLWLEARNEAELFISRESVLAEHLGQFPKADFERWGDPNHLPDVSKSWFKKGGINLDVQIDEINEVAPVKVSIEDAIDFVKAWKPGRYISPAQELLTRIEERFQSLTTFRIKEYYAQHLMRSNYHSLPMLSEAVPF